MAAGFLNWNNILYYQPELWRLRRSGEETLRRQEIEIRSFRLPVYKTWNDEWFLLACGDYASGEFNIMTVAWGSLGCMWKRPMAMVVVRPTRYTYRFMEKRTDFTICHFPSSCRDRLQYCGSHSGRDVDKIRGSGLTPIASTRVGSPGFEEADLIVECRKMYFDDFKPAHFLAGFIEENYPAKDYHRLYLGEIRAVFGAEEFRS
jgi:flavin reductase (DIM6/NTAB) family NADH-FMN oxidoreductase RutF